MTLKDFALLAGVRIVTCDKEKWGGTFGYTTDDHPNCSWLGFNTEDECYQGWASDTFGEHSAAALIKILALIKTETSE